uniref:Uncharacterized protein n=1 Tax=Quercus lobata TaxID=97700 RepID=A0A7N2N6Z7_QUELO
MTLVSRTEGLYSLNITFYAPLGIFLKYMRFESDGHLRTYDSDWNEESDLLREFIGVCDFPMACGKYGICTNDQCSCPPPVNGTNYFRQTNNNGYSLVTPLSCEDSEYHKESSSEAEEYYLDHVSRMLTRYFYHDLQAVTKKFSKELGRRGFGTVFEGTLINGAKVAVKRLDGLSQSRNRS